MALLTAFDTWPLAVRLLTLFVLGTCAGSFVNWATYTFRTEPLPESPWSKNHPRDERSSFRDRVPLWGWWRLQRKGKTLGYDFWIRPWLVEFFLGCVWVALYGWELGLQGLTFDYLLPAQAEETILWSQLLAHLVLVTLMAAVTLIDIDDQTIPDEITIPGTLLGLVFAALVPMSALPDIPRSYWELRGIGTRADELRPLLLSSPLDWPTLLNDAAGLAIALVCWWAWIVALLPRTWYARHGWARALRLCGARVVRQRVSRWLGALGVLGSAGIALCWVEQPSTSWPALVSALVGLAVGGGIIWGVRVIGSWALRREAMGFGDVTLLAMLGTFVGWQGAFVVFFLAPFMGIVLGLARWLSRRERVLPFGPFLCLAALVAIIFWVPIWDRLWTAFYPGWLVPAAIVCCGLGLAVTLRGLRALRGE